jgi:hypothetical protein
VKVNLKHIFGLGLKAFAADASPEDLAEAAKAMHEEPEAESDDKKAKDAKAAADAAAAKDAADKAAADKAATDAKAKDTAKATDWRAKRHAALDKALDEEEKGEDVDLSKLKDAMGDSEEEEEKKKEEGEDAEECPDCGELMEDCTCGAKDSEEEEEEKKEKKGEDRAAAADGAVAALHALRPFVAHSEDTAVRNAFNKVLGQAQRTSKQSNGSYGKFASVSRARDVAGKNPRGRAADSGTGGDDRIVKMQAFYDEAHKQGGK